ncbi:MAG: ComEC/Rec2 family competence protein [Anaerolineales bacterium]
MPLFWISLAFLCGILLAHAFSIPIVIWSIPALIVLVLHLPFSRGSMSRIYRRLTWLSDKLKISPTILSLMIVSLSLGAIRFQVSQPVVNPSFIAYYNDQSIEYVIDGTLVEAPDVRDTYTNLRINVNDLHPVGEETSIPVGGHLLARVSANTDFKYGDLIRLQGFIATPSENEDFSYRDYLANQGIYSTMSYPSTSLIQHGLGNPLKTALYAFRQRALDVIYKIYPDPEASLLAGILLGVESGIPQAVQEAFRLTGTSHIIVISGFNITIIAALFALLFSRLLGRRKGAMVAALGIILYTLLVGANAAVVRAAILGLLTLLGHQFGRRQVGLNSLAFTAAAMAIITPTVLWDISFQLSFAATLGIMLYAEPLTDCFTHAASRFIAREKAERLAGLVGEYFLLTLAAQITTLPLMIYYFKRLSLTSLVANPLILPAQPLVMVLGGLSVLSGMIFQPFGQFLAWAAWPFTAYTIRVVESLAAIPYGTIPLGQVAFPLILLLYFLLFLFTFTRSHFPSVLARLTPAIPLIFLAVTTLMVWKAAFYAPDERLHVTILDVGTGEAVLIQSPTGRSVLINGGPSTISLSDALGRRLSPFHRSLDWLVVADIDNEDLDGITANLERFIPNNILWAGNTYGTRSARDLWSQIIALSIPISLMQPGETLELGSGSLLSVISVDAGGAVLLLDWENFRMLLPMGMDFSAMESLQSDSTMRNISAVLLAESGYAPLNPPELIKLLNPQVALLSVAPADKTGLPSPETLEALDGYNLLRTDQNGWIEISTDGTQMWVEVERK